ncbi:hypothetical protein D3C80_1165290 [compost metagenome]
MTVPQAGTGHAAGIAEHFVQVLVPVQANIAVGGLFKEFVLEDFLRAQFVAPMDQVHFFGDVRQVQGFLDRRVAAADHSNHLIAIEKSITGRARRNPFAGERFFRRQAQVLRGGAGGNDQGVAGVGAAIADQLERPLLQLGGMDVVVNDLGGKAFGVFLHAIHQHRSGQAFNVAWPVIHFDGGGELAACLDAGNDNRLEVGAGGINCRAVTGRAGAQDNQAGMLRFAHKNTS